MKEDSRDRSKQLFFLHQAQIEIRVKKQGTNKMYVYCFDLDGTLCTQTEGDYLEAVPFMERIVFVNKLYEQGHTIKVFTARGSKSGRDWLDATRHQLSIWGLCYHELILGKPHADIYVDDKSRHPDDFDWQMRSHS